MNRRFTLCHWNDETSMWRKRVKTGSFDSSHRVKSCFPFCFIFLIGVYIVNLDWIVTRVRVACGVCFISLAGFRTGWLSAPRPWLPDCSPEAVAGPGLRCLVLLLPDRHLISSIWMIQFDESDLEGNREGWLVSQQCGVHFLFCLTFFAWSFAKIFPFVCFL